MFIIIMNRHISESRGNLVKIFLDSANISEIREAVKWKIIDGVTTNPSLLAKEGKKDIREVIKEICGIVKNPISVEVMSIDAHGMVEEAKEWASLDKNIVIKIPMCVEGLKAVDTLEKLEIPTNVTLIFSTNQAILALNAGADYISPFLGRIDDVGGDGLKLVTEIMSVMNNYLVNGSEVIAASIRSPQQIIECAKLGVDIVTVPFSVLKQMYEHPQTKAGIQKFLDDAKALKRGGK
jgi:transaldolase